MKGYNHLILYCRRIAPLPPFTRQSANFRSPPAVLFTVSGSFG